MLWQSFIYNSLRTDPSELAKVAMLPPVSKEHWLRLMDLSAGADEISVANPPSVRRQAPVIDKEESAGKQFADHEMEDIT